MKLCQLHRLAQMKFRKISTDVSQNICANLFLLICVYLWSIFFFGCHQANKKPEEITSQKVKPVEIYEEIPESVSTKADSQLMVQEKKPTGEIIGFRVQIFASSTMERAEQIAKEAGQRLGEKVYVEPTSPFFKVRVGNCLTKEEAEALRNKVRAIGYDQAFVVETVIELK
ncbi:MAG: SPOR domain-containing protein [Candidatus Edwardsbacteria bacterium]